MNRIDKLYQELQRSQYCELTALAEQGRASEARLAASLTDAQLDHDVLTDLALNHEVRRVRDAAAAKLARLLAEAQVDHIELTDLALKHKVNPVREAAGARLAKLLTEPEQDQSILLGLALECKVPAVRHTAIGKLKDPVVALCQAMEDASAIERRYAASTLAERGDARAVAVLCKALEDPDQQVRCTAASALGTIGEACALESLCKGFGDGDDRVRDSCVCGFRAILNAAKFDHVCPPSTVESLQSHELDEMHAAASRRLGDRWRWSWVGLCNELHLRTAELWVMQQTEQIRLCELARRHTDPLISDAAIGKLNDQVLLASLAIENIFFAEMYVSERGPDEGLHQRPWGVYMDPVLAKHIAEARTRAERRHSSCDYWTSSDYDMVERGARALVLARQIEVARQCVERLTDEHLLKSIALGVRFSLSGRCGDTREVDGLRQHGGYGGYADGYDGAAAVRKGYGVAAVRKLSDQGILAEVALRARCAGVRAAAIEMLTDPTMIAKCAQEDGIGHVREVAVSRITDQSVLEKVAKDKDPRVRAAAARRITDQALLRRLIADEQDSDARAAAVAGLSDQAELTRIAFEHTDESCRYAAVRKITDEAALARVVMQDKYGPVRSAAVCRLSDQELLARLAMGVDAFVRTDAVSRLTDQKLLAGVVEKADHYVLSSAIEQITDQALLASLFERLSRSYRAGGSPRSDGVRAKIIRKLDVDGAWLAKFALEDQEIPESESTSVRVNAVNRLTNQRLLKKVALRANQWRVCAAAVSKLTDQTLLWELAKHRDVGIAAWKQLTDEEVVARLRPLVGDQPPDQATVMELSKDPRAGVREMAVYRLGDEKALRHLLYSDYSDDFYVKKAIVETLEALEWLRVFAPSALRSRVSPAVQETGPSELAANPN